MEGLLFKIFSLAPSELFRGGVERDEDEDFELTGLSSGLEVMFDFTLGVEYCLTVRCRLGGEDVEKETEEDEERDGDEDGVGGGDACCDLVVD